MTPSASLRRRLVVVSVALVLMLAVVVDVLLYAGFRSELGRLDPGAPAADALLRQILAVQVLATLLAVGCAAVLFGWVVTGVVRPMEKMLAVVRRQTAGQRGERIRSQPQSLIGELGRAYDELLDGQEAALAQTQAARDRSRRFLADGAHQIRTPVAGIQACAETLLRRSRFRGAEEEQILGELLRETSQVGRLVSELLQVARLDQGVHLQPAPCDLVAVCGREVARVRSLAPWLDVVIVTPRWDGWRPFLDAEVVHDIVANLLDNARRDALTRITIATTREQEGLELRVAHDGVALNDEQAETVFQRCVTLHGQAGSGLGLPIAQELARLHGGDLRYQDRTFVVSLPLVVAGEKTLGDAPDSRHGPGASSGYLQARDSTLGEAST